MESETDLKSAEKRKGNPIARLINSCANHPWLKLISLLLSILVWFYVRGEMRQNIP